MKRYTTSHPFSLRIRSVAACLTLCFGLHGMVPMAAAGMIPSAVISTADTRAADLADVQQMLETKVVRHRLAELGFTTEEIEARIAFASDEELHQLASHSETLMAGGAFGVMILVMAGVLLTMFIPRINGHSNNQSNG
ncbi:MAG: PA2779 family protein [Verrucomicrobia bacterium]|nr:PA2779 family protein [Verrucomicrobiota bacterium]MCH8512021.1 PA2779 family protein [Kiritimatiellia bacterium]